MVNGPAKQKTGCRLLHGFRQHNIQGAAVVLLLLLTQHVSAAHWVTASGGIVGESYDQPQLARSLLQGGVLAPPPPPSSNRTSNSTQSSSRSGTRSGNKFSAFIATTIAASTGAIGVVSGVAGVAAANLGAGTVIQAAGALNMQATSAALVNLVQHIQIFAAMDAPVQQLALNSTYRDSVTKNITDALSWITFSTRGARCLKGAEGEEAPNHWERSRCLWRSGKDHVVVIAIVLGIAITIHALLVLLWNFTIGFVKPMPVVLVPPNLEILMAGVFILPLAAAATQLIAADTRQSITLAAFVIAFLAMYVLFLVYVLLGVVAQRHKYGLMYKRSVSTHGSTTSPSSGPGGSSGGPGGSGGKAMQRSASARRQLCMNINWPQWHGEWEVQGVPEDQRVTYRKQYVRTSRWYGFVGRLHRPQPNAEASKVLAVEIEDRLGGLHDPYRGDNILAYNWELVKLMYLVIQGVMLAATEASLEVGAMSWSLLWLQVAYTVLMTVLRPSRNQWLGWLDIAANWVRVGTFIAFIQLANRDDNIRKNLLTHLELTSIGIELLSTWVRILSMFIHVEGIYFAIKKPKFLTWAHKSIKHTMPFTADHINRVEATAAEVERVRSGRLPDVAQDSSPLLKPSGATAAIITPQQQAQKPPGRDKQPIKNLPDPSATQQLMHQAPPRKQAQLQTQSQTQTQRPSPAHPRRQQPQPVSAGKVDAAGATSPEEVQVQVPGRLPAGAGRQQAAEPKPGKTSSHPAQSVPDVAATVQLPEVAHLPAVYVPDREDEEEEVVSPEALAVPVAIAVSEQVPSRVGRVRPSVLQPEPAPEKLGELWQGGLGGRADPPAPAVLTAEHLPTTAAPTMQASSTSQSEGLKPTSGSRRFAQKPQSGTSPAVGPDVLMSAAPLDAVPAPGAPTSSQASFNSSGSTGQSFLEPSEVSGAASVVPPLMLGTAKYQKASFRSEGADMYHSLDSEFDEGGRLIGEDLGFLPTGEDAQLPGHEPQSPEMHTYQDMVVDEILKGMLMDIMSSRPNSMSSHVGPLVGMDTAEEDVQEALKRVLDHVHSGSLDGREDAAPLNVELLRLRLLHIHQDLLASWHQEPISPFRPQSPSYATALQNPDAIRTIRRAYSTRIPSQPTTPAQRHLAMRTSHTMPAAVASSAASGAVAAVSSSAIGASAAGAVAAGQGRRPQGLLGRSRTSAGPQTSAAAAAAGGGIGGGAYRHTQSMPPAVASAAAAAASGQDVDEPAAAGAMSLGADPAAKELKRARTAVPSRTAPSDTPVSLQYSRTMPTSVAATSADAAAAESGPEDVALPGSRHQRR